MNNKESKFLDKTLKEIKSLSNDLKKFYSHLQKVVDKLTPSSRKKIMVIVSKDLEPSLKKLQKKREQIASVCRKQIDGK